MADPYSGMNPNFSNGLHQLMMAVRAQGGNLTINSGKRERGEQENLYAKAVKKYGQTEARKWAAVPGTSNHEFGLAADIGGDSRSLQLAHNLASQFGLTFPLNNEPWHVEIQGAKQMHDNQGGPPDPQVDEETGQMNDPIARVSALFNHIDGTSRYGGFGGDTALDSGAQPYDATNVGDSDVSSFLGANQYDSLFQVAAQKYGISPKLLKAVAKQESNFNAQAKSGAGAQGLMQIMPGTAKGLGINALDPNQAVDGAAKLLSQYVKQFGSVDLALAAYNAGPGAVQKYGGIPPYQETKNYVQSITRNLG